ELYSSVQQLSNIFIKKLVACPNQDWQQVLQSESLKEIAFILNESREKGKRLLSDAEEQLIAELHKDGLAAWNEVYGTTVSIMTIPFTRESGEVVDLSVGQAMNQMYADPNPLIRKQLFENWEAAWEK